jgi:WD40 repeat protein
MSRIFRGRHTDFVSALDISIDGELLAFATMAEEMIRIWSRSDAQFVKEIRGGHTLRWSPRGQLLAIGAENQISVWNRSGAPLATFVGRGSRSNVEWLNAGVGLVFVADNGEPCILMLENAGYDS